MPLLRNRGHEKRRSLLNVLIVRYYVLEMACPIGLDCMLFLRSRTIRCKILCQIGDRVALGGKRERVEGNAGGGDGVEAGGVINEIGVKTA